MNESDWLAARFEDNRTHLRAVAYRMLGSLSEADDAVQEAWLRLSRSDTSGVENLRAWLTTVVARVCLNMLHARELRRGEALDGHLPDPIVSREDGIDPEAEAILADSVGLALLVVLDALTPSERLAFVLHDMFAVPFDEIALILGKSAAAAQQLASRARRRVQEAPSVPEGDLAHQRKVVDAFPRGLARGRLLIYQGTAWADIPNRSAEEKESLVAEYAAINEAPGVTPGLPLGLPENATTVRIKDGKAESPTGHSSTPRGPSPAGTSSRLTISMPRSNSPRGLRRRGWAARSRSDRSERIGEHARADLREITEADRAVASPTEAGKASSGGRRKLRRHLNLRSPSRE
jgi:RNA polymerase sigma factor (sigma-70 family)